MVRDLSKYDSDTVVFQPRNMSVEDLQQGWHWAQHQFYSLPSIYQRISGRGSSARMQYATNFQYHWFTRARFPRGYNPATRGRRAPEPEPPPPPPDRTRLPVMPS